MWVLEGAGLIIGVWGIFKLGGLGIRWCKEGLRRLEPDYIRQKKEMEREEKMWEDF